MSCFSVGHFDWGVVSLLMACFCCSYRVSIAMARHTAEQVENKGIRQLNVHHRCGPLKGLLHAFNRMRDLCTPGEEVGVAGLPRCFLPEQFNLILLQV